MNTINRHRIMLIKVSEDHSEEWHCPICGRIMLVKWEPFSLTYPVEGDQTASHYADLTSVEEFRLHDYLSICKRWGNNNE